MVVWTEAAAPSRLGLGRAGSGTPLAVLLLLYALGSVSCSDWSTVPSVPSGVCLSTDDCRSMGWTDPLPACESRQCRCPPNTCTIYTTGHRDYYLYFCGACGMLGSECGNKSDCMVQWQCQRNFCTCDKGDVYRGVCLYYEPVPTSVSSVVLVIIFILLVIVQKTISSREAFRRRFCGRRRSSSESEDGASRVVASNPRSNTKTAAFTITNSDFMVTSEDSELDWTLELSRQLSCYGVMGVPRGVSTWSSVASSVSPPDPRFSGPARRPASSSLSQPGTSGWSPEAAGSTRTHRRSSRSLPSSSFSSYPGSYTSDGLPHYPPSYPHSSPHHTSSSISTTSSRPPTPPPPALDDITLETFNPNYEDTTFRETRV